MRDGIVPRLLPRRPTSRLPAAIPTSWVGAQGRACLGGAGKVPLASVMYQLGPRWLIGSIAGVACFVSGCRRQAVDEDPTHLVREFIVLMQRVHGDQKTSRAVFDLLWSPARKNLTERAARASALAGRKVAPEEMITPSRFTLRFEPKRITVNTTADRAVVTVQGDPPLRETREVRCVREDGRWRVVLDLPILPPIQKRPETVKDE